MVNLIVDFKDELFNFKMMGYVDVVKGNEIYNFFGNCVIKIIILFGVVLVVKVKFLKGFDCFEVDMM